jgi:uncharacterized protein (DUF1330 family)
MITCFLRYEVDADKLEEFETYARMWIPLIEKFGGTHHGYFLPHEGASDAAYALFSFPSLGEYEHTGQKQKPTRNAASRSIIIIRRSVFAGLSGLL